MQTNDYRTCETCKYRDISVDFHPCRTCSKRWSKPIPDKWEPREARPNFLDKEEVKDAD